MRHSSSLRIALAAGLLVAGTAATAAAQTSSSYDLSDRSGTGACTQTSAGTSGIGNTYSCAAVGSTTTSLRITAAATTGTSSTSGFQGAAVTDQGASGLGIGNQTEGGASASGGNGDHSVDNANDAGTDLLMLEFVGGPQALQSVSLGWTGGDADFQVLRWGGATMPAITTIGGAIGAGWQLVTTVNGTGTGSYAVNAGNLAATYWAIGAYNPAFGNTLGSAVDGGDDKFKVNGLKTATPAAVVPEPSTYALMATGLAGLLAAARRRRAA